MEFSLIIYVSLGVALLSVAIATYSEIKRSKMRQSIKRVGQLSSQSKSICSSLDSLEEDLIHGRIGANSAKSVLQPIKRNMEALNGEIEDIYNEYIKKRKKKKTNKNSSKI